MQITDTDYSCSITAMPSRSASLVTRLWAEIYFEFQVLRLRREVLGELSMLSDKLLEDIGTFRGDLHEYADRSARQWIEFQIAQNPSRHNSRCAPDSRK